MNLVVQGAVLAPAALAEVAALVGATQSVALGASAWRFTGATRDARIGQWCADQQVDCAWVPDERRLADLRLVAMDMDSTLVTIESIDEMGDLLGIRPQIAAVTAQAMRGEIDYPEALRRRVALLAGSKSNRWSRSARSACTSRRARRRCCYAAAPTASARCWCPAGSASLRRGCRRGSASMRCFPTSWRSSAAA
jgi:hypothetical protein